MNGYEKVTQHESGCFLLLSETVGYQPFFDRSLFCGYIRAVHTVLRQFRVTEQQLQNRWLQLVQVW